MRDRVTRCFASSVPARFFSISCLLMALGLGLAITAAAQQDTLTIGLIDETAALDPAKAYETTSMSLILQLYDQLISFKNDDLTQPVPKLAESWELEEDGRTWTFHLRPDLTFVSGNPVNADAVVFSLRRTIAMAQPPSWILTQFGLSEETITKVDDLTVQIVLNQQYAPALLLSCLSSSPASILDPAVVAEHEQDGDMGSAWLESHSAGNGAYIHYAKKCYFAAFWEP